MPDANMTSINEDHTMTPDIARAKPAKMMWEDLFSSQ